MKAPTVKCVRCSAAVKYVALGNRATMLDAVPHAAGNVRIREDGAERPTGTVLAGESMALATGKLYRVHDCTR